MATAKKSPVKLLSAKSSPAKSSRTLGRAVGAPLPLQLLRGREAVMQLFRPHLREVGLTDQQGRILRVLAERKWVEMRELSAETCIHPASLSRMIPRMHANGIVRRWKNRADGRRVMVAITKRGLALLRVIARHSVQIYAAVARKIGAARLRELHLCLDILIASLDRSAPEPAARQRKTPSRKRAVARRS